MMTVEQYVEKEAKKSLAIEIARTLLSSGADRERVKKSLRLFDKQIDALLHSDFEMDILKKEKKLTADGSGNLERKTSQVKWLEIWIEKWKIGFKKGIKQGIEKGMEEGKKEGKKEFAIEIARAMLLSVDDRERVKVLTRLSDKEIDAFFVQKIKN